MSLRSVAVLAACVLLAACSKINQENYSKLKAGMSKAEVEAILGKPTECSGALGMSSCTWGDEKAFISVQYAADKVGNEAAYPRDLRTRADINRWMLWEAASWFPSCYVYRVENCVKPLLGGAADPAVLAAQDAQFHKLAGILNERLSHHEWVAGTPQPTIADIALAAPIHLHGWQKLPLQPHAHVRRWMFSCIEALPSWDNTWVGEGFTTDRAMKKAA